MKLSRGLKKSNVLFGWKQTTETYPRDEEREHSNLGRRTDIVKHTVTLDNYTLSNATYSKITYMRTPISTYYSHLNGTSTNLSLQNCQNISDLKHTLCINRPIYYLSIW